MSLGLNEDFRDFLERLIEEEVRFVIVGAHALAVHGLPRATGDIDVFVEARPDNARRLVRALEAFGAPLEQHGVKCSDFQSLGTVYQLGLPPRRIDILTQISGLTFEEVWSTRFESEVDGLELSFIGRTALVRNKRASGRAKDLADLAALESRSD